MVDKRDSRCWCPVCFDELDCVELENDDGMITKYIYQCLWCDKWFELTEFDIGERVFGAKLLEENKNGK